MPLRVSSCAANTSSTIDVRGHFTAQRGSVVLVALCLTVVLGVVVVGYVAVCARTMEMSNRSFCTTSSVQLAEIGMEEALWSLDQALQAFNNSSSFDWSGNGWNIDSASIVTKLPAGFPPFATNQGIQGSVTVQIINYNPQNFNPNDPATFPQITSTGKLQMPDGITIQKQLVATVKPAALFSNAVGSTVSINSSPPPPPPPNPPYYVDFTSGGSVDSYDSSLGTYNCALVPSGTNQSDNAIISGPYVFIGAANVLGYATTANSNCPISPYFYPPSITSGSVTNLPATDNNRLSNNANQYAFGIVPPVGPNGGLLFGGAVTGSQTIGTAATTPSIYYDGSNGINLSGNDTLTIDGPVIIFISNDLKIAGGSSASIVLTANGSAQIYVMGNLDIEGGGIDNQTLRPRKLAIFCIGSPPSTVQVINTATPFYGAVYVPNSPLTVNSNLTVYGALVGQSVTFNGTPTIHYDLDLRRASFSVVNTPYDIAQWLVSN